MAHCAIAIDAPSQTTHLAQLRALPRAPGRSPRPQPHHQHAVGATQHAHHHAHCAGRPSGRAAAARRSGRLEAAGLGWCGRRGRRAGPGATTPSPQPKKPAGAAQVWRGCGRRRRRRPAAAPQRAPRLGRPLCTELTHAVAPICPPLPQQAAHQLAGGGRAVGGHWGDCLARGPLSAGQPQGERRRQLRC